MKAVAVLIAALVTPRHVAAQAPDTLRVAEAVRLALAANPMLLAVQARARAMALRVGPAGALPDPALQLAFMNRMVSSLGATDDPMTMNQVQLMQTLPWPGKLGNARDAARHEANASFADADDAANMLAARVRSTYYDIAYIDRALAVMRRTQALQRQYLDVSTAMYAGGAAPEQDVLRAQVEVARMTEEIVRMEQDREVTAARLNALLGRDVATAVGALELPEPRDSLPAAGALMSVAAATRPALRAGAERLAAADASLAAARREILPDLEIGVQYQQRPQFPDMASLMIGASIPLFAGSRQLAMREEAIAMRDMARAELVDLGNETAARIVEARARAAQAATLLALYRTSILPQARAAVDAALSGYRAGRVAFMQLADNQMVVNRYESAAYRLLADYWQARGELAALTGRSPEAHQ